MKPCVRCRGAKKMYKVGGIYSFIDTGGKHVSCPLCLGKGKMPSGEELKKDTEKAQSKILKREENADIKEAKKIGKKAVKKVSKKSGKKSGKKSSKKGSDPES